ncbi:MAG: NFACT RNA binding domain-containing protein [Gemmatimonadota bacterium]|nr:NFACT RNA binding domain-containing protein [Gemmatimonadota bacterium]
MSVRYDPLVARALARAILDRRGSVPVRSIRLDRDRRAARMGFADGGCLVAALHPTAGFLVELAPEACEAVALGGAERRFAQVPLIAAETPDDERALVLVAGDPGGAPRQALALELQTNRWNALDLTRAGGDGTDGDEAQGEGDNGFWRTEAALLTRESGGRSLRRGVAYEPPRSTRRGIDAVPEERAWIATFEGVEPDERRVTLLRTWAWASTLNADWILGRDEAFDPSAAYRRYRELHPSSSDATAGAWLLERPWGGQPYPHPLGGAERIDGDVLAGFAALAEASGGIATILAETPGADEPAGDDEAALLAKRLRKRRKRAVKRIRALQRQLEGAEAPEEPRGLGHLLLARKADVPRGRKRVALKDFEGKEREIELDPALDAVGNAERLFDEARRRERALERLPSEIGRAEARRDELARALERLESEGPSDELWKLAGGRPGSKRASRRPKAEAPERLPYTRYRSSGGLEIRVGRGARDNDELTFHHSAPDDIWLHASQSSGAHVILRWGRKDENPPRRDLAEAALAAAVHSGARHSGTVAVVWTRRKYVRSPRKSPPGTVVPDRVQTVFVKPDEDRLRAMKAEDG